MTYTNDNEAERRDIWPNYLSGAPELEAALRQNGKEYRVITYAVPGVGQWYNRDRGAWRCQIPKHRTNKAQQDQIVEENYGKDTGSYPRHGAR